MKVIKILFLTDSHLTAKTPASRLDVYETVSLEKLEKIGEIIKENQFDLVIHGGDMFHTAKVSLRYGGMVAELLKKWEVPIIVIPGNHDLYGYSMTTIDQTMLGLLTKTGIVRLLTRENKEGLLFTIEDKKLNMEEKTLSIEGQEYYGDIDKGNSTDYEVNSKADYKILVTHSMLLEKPFFEGVPHTLIKDVNTNANLILSGHYHDGYKDVISKGTQFINPGAIIRVESSRKDMPKMVSLEFELDEFGEIFLDWDYIYLDIAKSREEVFDLESQVAKKYSKQVVETFRENLLQMESLQSVNTVAEMILAISNEMKIEKSVSDIALEKIANAEILSEEVGTDYKGFIEKKYKLGIKEVYIENFQSHKKSVIEFENGLNIITGESNNGKTSVFRAILYCLFNTKGSDFIRTGEKSCTVQITFTDGSSIKRSRSRTSSGSYEVIDSNGEVKEFKGFGSDIPVEVMNEHQMPEILISKDVKVKLNVADQLEPAFLITASPSVRANAIGKLTGVEVMDLAIKDTNRTIQDKNKKIKEIKGLVTKYEEQLKQFDDLEKMKEYIEIIEKLDIRRGKITENINSLISLSEREYKIANSKALTLEELDRIPNLVSIEKEIKILERVINETENLESKRLSLENIKYSKPNKIKFIRYAKILQKLDSEVIESIKTIDDVISLRSLYSNVAKTSKIKKEKKKDVLLLDKIQIVKPLIEKHLKSLEILEKLEKYNKAIDEINNKKIKLNKLIKDIEENEKMSLSSINKVKENLSEYIEENNICPICNKVISVEDII